MNTAPTSSLSLAVKHPGSPRQPFDPVEPTASSSAKRLGHTTAFDGNDYQLEGARNEPKGLRRAHYGSPRYAQHWNFAGSPPELFAPKRDVLAARCADIGRDPKEITMSAHLRLEPDRNYGQVLEDAAGLAAEGLGLGIVCLSPPHDPAVLEPLAEAIRIRGGGISDIREI